MIAARIPKATRYLGAPAGWKPDEHGDCAHLAIRDMKVNGDVPAMMSLWEPTPEELERLNAGAKVSLIIIGRHDPFRGVIAMERRTWSEWRDWIADKSRRFEACKSYEALSAELDAASRELHDREDALLAQPSSELIERATDWLSTGGLFNPELMEPQKTTDLILDMRAALTAAYAAREKLEAQDRQDGGDATSSGAQDVLQRSAPTGEI